MNDETNSQPNLTPDSGPEAPQSNPPENNGRRVVQPSETLVQELQQVAVQPVEHDPQTQQPVQVQQPMDTPPITSVGAQSHVGMSASQMGFGEPKNKFSDLNPRSIIIKAVAVLVALGGVFAILVFTNIIALSEFKTLNYVNSAGTSYKLEFYTKHGTKQLQSGNAQLVSKVSKNGKFPLLFSISEGEASSYSKLKDCTGFSKEFDVRNDNLNQTISVCSESTGQPGIYVAGFIVDSKVHVIAISQDLSGVDLSSQSGAKESLIKFGIGPYEKDLSKIISSISIN